MVTCSIDSNENQQNLHYQLNQQLQEDDGAQYHLALTNHTMEAHKLVLIRVKVLNFHSSIVMNKKYITCEKDKNASTVINIRIGMQTSLEI